MSNEIEKINNGTTLDQMLQQADLFVKSGFFPRHVDTKEKACVIMLKGRELGLPFTEALSKISVINGVATTKVETLLGLAQSRGIIEDLQIKDLPTYCEVTIKRKGQSPYTCRFGDAEAAAMGLSGKDNYKKQKSVMYRWRALAMNLRVTCPDAIGGLYLEEEIADDVVIRPATQDSPTEVTEIIKESQNPQIVEAKPSSEDNGEVSDDDLPHWVMPIGKYSGKRLIEIYEEQTGTGKAKGLEYLIWCAENVKTEALREKIQRFLQIMDQSKDIQV